MNMGKRVFVVVERIRMAIEHGRCGGHCRGNKIVLPRLNGMKTASESGIAREF